MAVVPGVRENRAPRVCTIVTDLDEMKAGAPSHTIPIDPPRLIQLPDEFRFIPTTDYHRLVYLHIRYHSYRRPCSAKSFQQRCCMDHKIGVRRRWGWPRSCRLHHDGHAAGLRVFLPSHWRGTMILSLSKTPSRNWRGTHSIPPGLHTNLSPGSAIRRVRPSMNKVVRPQCLSPAFTDIHKILTVPRFTLISQLQYSSPPTFA